ncbi:helix-turn-helix domain-containing protein [Vibrio sinaloensis]|uniref:helix-turn-helix domain-containing protein n=1 Tax=Photobacterium sp. (strain ATCC 43367) TaxID=379097 RepID=UPI00206A8550|nr:helix-turn-helix domain-containing protein [Vibrio sinaloensis]UPQ90004.1 helix-turn-helix domain-containing protein [Vibrio sinaloensis]
MQGIWSACVDSLQQEPICKSLYSDAGSGIVFHLDGEVTIAGNHLPQGVILLPVEKSSQLISLSAGTQIAGIRFHPAIGYGVLGRLYDEPTVLSVESDTLYRFYDLYSELKSADNNNQRVTILSQWIGENFDFSNVIPKSLQLALDCIRQEIAPGELETQVALSQRQIERQFKQWIEMTPKQYQRILRVREALDYLRTHHNVELVEVAQRFGFSDQAHMTREFKAIAAITPGRLVR